MFFLLRTHILLLPIINSTHFAQTLVSKTLRCFADIRIAARYGYTLNVSLPIEFEIRLHLQQKQQEQRRSIEFKIGVFKSQLRVAAFAAPLALGEGRDSPIICNILSVGWSRFGFRYDRTQHTHAHILTPRTLVKVVAMEPNRIRTSESGMY